MKNKAVKTTASSGRKGDERGRFVRTADDGAVDLVDPEVCRLVEAVKARMGYQDKDIVRLIECEETTEEALSFLEALSKPIWEPPEGANLPLPPLSPLPPRELDVYEEHLLGKILAGEIVPEAF